MEERLEGPMTRARAKKVKEIVEKEVQLALEIKPIVESEPKLIHLVTL